MEKPEKEYTLQEAKNMLLRLAGGGIEFLPVNNAFENGNKVWPIKWIDGELYMLAFRVNDEIHPKFDSPQHFWDAFNRPTFDQSYIWTKNK